MNRDVSKRDAVSYFRGNKLAGVIIFDLTSKLNLAGEF